jgi:hypothetical protein
MCKTVFAIPSRPSRVAFKAQTATESDQWLQRGKKGLERKQ